MQSLPQGAVGGQPRSAPEGLRWSDAGRGAAPLTGALGQEEEEDDDCCTACGGDREVALLLNSLIDENR